MKRAITVLLLATLTALFTGVNDASWAGQPADPQAREEARQRVSARIGAIPLRAVVRIDRTDGTRVDAVLEEVTPDAIAVTVLRPKRDEGTLLRIPKDEIATIEELRGSTLRKVLIGVGIAVAVLVGTCAVALNSEGAKPTTTTDAPHPSGP